MTTYERVRYRPEGGRTRSIYLQDPVVSGDAGLLGATLTGIEVDREGIEVTGRGFDERRHVISLDLVLEREPMVIDRLYGHLVDPAEATEGTTQTEENP